MHSLSLFVIMHILCQAHRLVLLISGVDDMSCLIVLVAIAVLVLRLKALPEVLRLSQKVLFSHLVSYKNFSS